MRGGGIVYALLADNATDYYALWVTELRETIACNARLYLQDARYTIADVRILSVNPSADGSEGADITYTFTGRVGAITYPFRQAMREAQQLFTNCNTTLSMEQYKWTSLSVTITCQPFVEEDSPPLTLYAAFAIPRMQLPSSPGIPGFATGVIQEDSTGRCADLAASVGSGSTVFGYSLGRTGCGLWERKFHAAMNLMPGVQGLARLYMGGSTCSGTPGISNANSPVFTTLRENAANVLTVLQAGTVYPESTTVGVRYLLTDAKGRPQVSASGLTVSITINAGGSAKSGNCGSPNTASGVGLCTITANAGMFSTSADVAASAVVQLSYAGVSAATSASMLFTLKQKVTHTPPVAANIFITLPTAPVYVGESFTLTIKANTGGSELYVSNHAVNFNSVYLEYVSFSTSSLFLASANLASAGSVEVLFLSPAPSVTRAQTKGDSISVGTMTFKLKSSAPVGVIADVFDVFVTQMGNWGLNAFVSVTKGVVNDFLGSAEKGDLMVASPFTVGIAAYAMRAEMFNMAPLTGSASTVNIMVSSVLSRAGLADGSLGAAPSCVSSDTDVLVAIPLSGKCVIRLGDSQSKGDSGAFVNVTFEGYSQIVPLRVWYPTESAITLTDYDLGVIAAGNATAADVGCRSTTYQNAHITATATFGGAGLTSVLDNEVTCTSTFKSSDTAVATVSGTEITGVAAGTTSISFAGTGVLPTAAALTVSNTTVAVRYLLGSLLTSIAMTMTPNTIALTSDKFVVAQAELKHELAAEGANGRVYVWAHLADGTVRYLQKSEGLVVALGANVTETLSLEEVSSGTSDYKVTVKEGASGATEAAGLVPTWSICGAQIATGIVPVNVELAKPESVSLSTSNARMTRAGDAASRTPIGVPTTISLTAVMTFDDATSRDFSNDPRTVFELVGGGDLATLSGRTLTAIEGASGVGTITVKVSFPFYAPLISSTDTVSFVKLDSLAATSYPYPSYSGSTGSQKSVLNLVACTGVYQQTLMSSRGTMSDASTYDLSSYASYQSQATGIVDTGITSGRYAKGKSVGSTSVIPSFFGVSAAALPFTVTNDKTRIVELLHKTGWSSSTTFVGVQAGSCRLNPGGPRLLSDL